MRYILNLSACVLMVIGIRLLFWCIPKLAVTLLATSRRRQSQSAPGVGVKHIVAISHARNIQGVSRIMPEPTKAQKEAVTKLREVYGRQNVKEHAADPTTGHIRVELKCEAGMWNWFYDRNGLYINGSMSQRLFEPEPPPHTPGNAIDN